MRNNTEKSLSSAKVQLKPVRGVGGCVQSQQPNALPLSGYGMDKAHSTRKGWEAQDELLQLLLNRETALAQVSDWWLVCPQHMSKEQASSCKLFSACFNQEKAAIPVKWQMLLPVIRLSKNALIFRNMGWCVLVSKGNCSLFILTCPWHTSCYLFLEFSSWIADSRLFYSPSYKA